jgi:Asp-tRNA(Asn)/Glu-tRNA(Gln) amidotransferase A subunit family amidase
MTRQSDLAPRTAPPPDFDRWEQRIGAFVCLADDGNGPSTGPLAGRTVAVKDVIDVAGLPTRNGSATCAGRAPAPADAPVVERLRAAGARIVGKTVTTEFAFTDPTPCRNPYALDRSPGGSSSGSGAAVGAGLVDIALGTQTAGSLCRPAAYCGAVGFKPGLGALPMAGVTPLSPRHDMVGIIARSVALAEAAYCTMRDTPAAGAEPFRRAGRLILDPTTPVDPARLAALDDMARIVSDRTGPVTRLPTLPDADRIVADHRAVMVAEAANAHGHLLEENTKNLLRPNFREGLQAGRDIAPADHEAAVGRLAAARAAFWNRHGDIDLFLTLPVPDGPPLIGASTGFQHWLTVWTVLGGPLLCLPWGLDENGLPLSVMLAARPGDEARLLAFGRDLADAAPAMPRPVLPGA